MGMTMMLISFPSVNPEGHEALCTARSSHLPSQIQVSATSHIMKTQTSVIEKFCPYIWKR